ncbi:MAG: inorganic phosphate transporter [Myxococcota bacterium]|nr:inorganic phosphate transporter [Myxococcota bacterium]
MAWGIGANDVANAMGTSVGSGALTLRGAIIVAAVLEFSGAFLAGGHVTDTVRKGMLDMEKVALSPELLVYGMLAALASAATLLLIASSRGLPISTTHSIVGAIIGFGMVAFGVDAVAWGKVTQIILSWVTSPLLGGVLAFFIFRLIRRLILNQENPTAQARTYGPWFFFVVFFIIGLVTLFKGLKNLNLDFDLGTALVLSIGLGILGLALGSLFVRRVANRVAAEGQDSRSTQSVERVFVVLQILTACAVAFAHGSNDVANSIGPLAAVVNSQEGVDLVRKSAVAPWMLALGGVGIVFGLATWGYRVMETIGRKITELTPSRGFAAELAAAMTIVLASRLGIPVSTTHILVGGVLGVGLARGIEALDMRVVGKVLISWVATLPIAAVMSIGFFYLIRAILSP